MEDDRIVIRGGRELRGKVQLHGAKNAVLPILAAALLTDEKVSVEDCPYISDVDGMVALLRALGADVEREGRRISVSGRACRDTADASLYSTMRSSMFMLGALLASVGKVTMPLPGGCAIGARPLDIHIDGMRRLGAKAAFRDETLTCRANKLCGADIIMKYPSVGATENLLMCAVLAEGTTKLIGCAREPEIVALARALRAMGARIYGDGSSVITVEGVDKLYGASVRADGDRIVAGTVLAATALCGGDVSVYGVKANELGAVISALKTSCCSFEDFGTHIRVVSDGRICSGSVCAAPYPLFPTDMQPQMCALLCYAEGCSKVMETVFENRFAHIAELKKMGACASVYPGYAAIEGRRKLFGADMIARDLRGGASLCIAAMRADGISVIREPHFIDRGYENFTDIFSSLGADIMRKRDFTP